MRPRYLTASRGSKCEIMEAEIVKTIVATAAATRSVSAVVCDWEETVAVGCKIHTQSRRHESTSQFNATPISGRTCHSRDNIREQEIKERIKKGDIPRTNLAEDMINNLTSTGHPVGRSACPGECRKGVEWRSVGLLSRHTRV